MPPDKEVPSIVRVNGEGLCDAARRAGPHNKGSPKAKDMVPDQNIE